MNKKYDYLIVGAGLFGSVFAHEAKKREKKCLVIDKRLHVGGNVYCEKIEDINVHKYGAHIFHTNNKKIWDYVNSFVPFNHYVNSPIALYKDKLYNLPFNMNTFNQIWGVITPQQAVEKINEQRKEITKKPSNLEEQAIALVGRDIYEVLIKGYTEKQWGKRADELPAFIIKRLPVRFIYDNNYFNDTYQGIPIGGYNKLIEGLLLGIEVKKNVSFFENREKWENIANKIVYTGNIDEYFDYKFGKLEYRSLKFEHEHLNTENFQGNSVINYTEKKIPFTRIIEHKHFEFGNQPTTVITREYSQTWQPGMDSYYPINDKKNNGVYSLYKKLADKEVNTIFGGRLANYKYYDMHQVIGEALTKTKTI